MARLLLCIILGGKKIGWKSNQVGVECLSRNQEKTFLIRQAGMKGFLSKTSKLSVPLELPPLSVIGHPVTDRDPLPEEFSTCRGQEEIEFCEEESAFLEE